MASMPVADRYRVDGVEGGGVSPLDRGLRYGDGAFTTVRVHLGRRWLWADHVARLAESCERLGIPWGEPLRRAIEVETLEMVGDDSGVLRVTVTRGVGGRGYAPAHDPLPTRILTFSPLPTAVHGAIAVRLCRTRVGLAPSLAGVKHLNRLENVLARSEWDDPAVAEGILRDLEGHVVGATAANVFARHGRRLLTPALEHCGVAGVMRRQILERRIPALGGLVDEVSEAALELEDLRTADELFLTNAVRGVWPIARLLDHGAGTLATWEAPGAAAACIAESIAPYVEPGDA